MTPGQFTALLLAGVRPGGDPFAASHDVPAKALIPVAGEPMIARPIRALLASPHVGAVRILTQRADLLAGAVPADPRISFGESGATIAATLEAILADPATIYPLLVTTADHALLDPGMIADFCARGEDADLAIGVVERETLMARLPNTSRTWIPLKGGAYSGANLFAFGSQRAAKAVALWRSVEQDRKKGWKLLAALGAPGLLGLLGLRDLEQVVASIGRRLGLDARAVVMTDPIAAVDIDKPADLALAESIISGAM